MICHSSLICLRQKKTTTHLLVYVIPVFVETSMLVIICLPLKLTGRLTHIAVFESPGTNFLLQLTHCRWYKPWGICPFSKVMRLRVLLFTDLWLFVLFLVPSLTGSPTRWIALLLLLTLTQPQPELHRYRNWTWLNYNLALGYQLCKMQLAQQKQFLYQVAVARATPAAGFTSTHMAAAFILKI